MKTLRITFAVVAMLGVSQIRAQNWPMPGATWEPSVLCSGCKGKQNTGALNDGAPTYPYTLPFGDHIGRTVDSSFTLSYQNIGLRTVRAGRVRVSADGSRLYMDLGGAIGVYTMSTLFTDRLLQPMAPVSVIPTGSPVGGYGRQPLEQVAAPDAFFYAEAATSGWTTVFQDLQYVLKDFDSDDRDLLYVATAIFGWGIHHDDGRTDRTHLPFVAQITSLDYSPEKIFSLKNGTSYYAVLSSKTSGRTTVYDVTTPSAPALVDSRTGSEHGIVAWAKNAAAERLALISRDGFVRVHSYAGFLAGDPPLAAFAVTSGKTLDDLSFDESGALWVVEGAGLLSSNVLWRLTPDTDTYAQSTFDVYGGPFDPQTIHAGAGHVAVFGIESDGVSSSSSSRALRLFEVNGGTPQAMDHDHFFRRYYHNPPTGYANPAWGGYIQNARPYIVAHGSKTYLFYQAFGLGDVYVLDDGSPVVSSISPASGPTIGGTNVTIYGLNFSGQPSVAFDGQAASSTLLSPNTIAAFAPHHERGTGNVLAAFSNQAAPSPQRFTWTLEAPASVSAAGTGTSSASVSWTQVATAQRYDVVRRGAGGTFTFDAGADTSFVDSGLASESVFSYSVRSVDAYGHTSALSFADTATTIQIARDGIAPGMPIKRAHVLEARKAANAIRAAAGYPGWTFADPNPTAIQAAHITELQAAIGSARSALGAPLTWTPVYTPILVRALHFQELLNAIE